MTSLRSVYDTRRGDAVDWYEYEDGNEALQALSGAGELIELVYGEAHAARAMTAIQNIIECSAASGPILDKNGTEDSVTWREMWRELNLGNGFQSSPFLEAIQDLNAFANYGIQPTWYAQDMTDDPNDDHAELQAIRIEWRNVGAKVDAICADIDRLELLAPPRDDNSPALKDLLETRDRARARLKFDAGEPMTIHELAALSKVTVKRIQNAVYAKTEEAPVVAKSGLISHDACETWLAARDYLPSIWQEIAALGPLQPNWGEDVVYEAPAANQVFDDYVMVPVAADGTFFHPALARKSGGREGGYTIGAKGAEEVVHGFEAALEALTKMVTPRWRRPNPESGNWGIVSGQTWKRLRASEFDALIR